MRHLSTILATALALTSLPGLAVTYQYKVATKLVVNSASSLGAFSVPGAVYGDAAFTLASPTSSGPGAFYFVSSNSAVATIAGSLVTVVGAGTSTITATQAASGSFSAASIAATLTVAKAVPTLAALSLPNKSAGDAPFALTAPSTNSPGVLTYASASPAVATISGSTVTVVGGGTSAITVNQAATANYVAASQTATLTVGSSSVNVAFTNCSASGAYGPTLSQCNSAYSASSLAGAVSVTSGFQYWTVPSTGTYTIRVIGAQGGTDINNGQFGYGAAMTATMSLTAGTQLKIAVGQRGRRGASRDISGGGGGTFVAQGGTLLMAAGGGGGYGASGGAGQNAGLTTTGTMGNNTGGTGGTGSGGGTTSTAWGGGGAGYSGNGGYDTNYGGSAALSFINGATGGGAGGTNGCTGGPTAVGGFGGGGGGGCDGGGGGGGYSGGASGGGSGGSYYTGTLTGSSAGQSGDGSVNISKP